MVNKTCYAFCRVNDQSLSVKVSDLFWHHLVWNGNDIMYYISKKPCNYEIPSYARPLMSTRDTANQTIISIWEELVTQLLLDDKIYLECHSDETIVRRQVGFLS